MIRRNATAALFCLTFALAPAAAQIIAFTGKVLMPNGSPPPKAAAIEKVCGNWRASVLTRTNRDGSFLVRLEEFDTVRSFLTVRRPGLSMSSCRLRASFPGYQSSVIELDSLSPTGQPVLPDIRLTPRSQPDPDLSAKAPKNAQKAWRRATLAAREEKWAEAQTRLQQVTAQAPGFAPAWALTGLVAQKLDAPDQAIAAFHKAAAADPSNPAHLYLLLESQIKAGRWQDARDSAALLQKADPHRRFPEAPIFDAIARYNLRDLDGASAAAAEALRLDKDHRFPRAELVYGRVLEMRGDPRQAVQHYRKYLELEPGAPETASLRPRIARLDAGERLEPDSELAAVDLRPSLETEVWIPGGLAALARIARIQGPLDPARFFAGYCEALARYALPGEGSGIPGYLDSLRAYFLAIRDLSRSGEATPSGVRIILSLHGPHRDSTARVLALLGWRIVHGASVEPGDAPEDGPKQDVLYALGIDALAMQRALDSGRTFEFQIAPGHAQLRGGDAWLSLVQVTRPLTGGIAEAFAEQPLLAKAYAGLARVSPEIAILIPSALGARNMAGRNADLVYRHASAFRLNGSSIAAPGGEAAFPTWEQMAGASPRRPTDFIRAVLTKDRGTMAAFYAAVARASESRQRCLMAHAPEIYKWYPQAGIARTHALIENLPLDHVGNLRWPGGPHLWKPAAFPDAATAEQIAALARIEDRRGKPLDPPSADLLRRHYHHWRPLFPYLERLRDWGEPQALALEQYTTRLLALPPAERELSLGGFYSLLELISLAVESQSLDAPSAVRAFLAACESGDPAAVLREIAAGRPLPAFLLTDQTASRGFQQILQLQNVPPLDSANPRDRVLALSGLVYAARLSPSELLVSEDPGLLRRHRFSVPGPEPFSESQLVRSTGQESYFQGGFTGFDKLAQTLMTGPAWDEPAPPSGQPVAAPGAPPVSGTAAPAAHIFRADSRLVMVHVTVTDSRGHYVDGLKPEQFQVVEDGQPRPPVAFESLESGVSCALLLDTTASMHLAMPSLKSAALRFIRDLRPVDSVAVYNFSDSLHLLQPFTPDKEAAQRAVLQAFPSGQTALYDSLARLTRSLSARGGKKVIVLFTDGEDNASALASQHVTRRIKAAGTPVYTVAQGQAIHSRTLLKELAELSKSTGGLDFIVESGSSISPIFERIAQDLAHGYLISFTPLTSGKSGWRAIDVVVKSDRRLKVRAREGYSLD